MSFRNQVLSALKWTLVGRLSTQFISWAITLSVMHMLVPEDYGLVAMATIFSGFFSLVAEIGLGSSLVQSSEVSTRQIRQVFAAVLLSNFSIFGILSLGVAPLAAIFFAEPRLEQIIPVVALQFIPAAFSVLPGAILDRELSYRGRSLVDFVSGLSGGLLTLGLAFAGYGAWSLAWGSVLSAFLSAVGLNYLKPIREYPLFDFSGSGTIFRFGRDVAANQLVFYFYSQADALVVGKLLGRHALGLYSVSMDLASLPASRIASILNKVAFPSMSMVKRSGGKVNSYILKSVRSISLISFPVMWGISSVSPEIVSGFLGDKWSNATTALSILSLIMPLRVLGPIIHGGLQSVGRADVSFRNTISTGVVMCIAFVVGCQFGLIGVALAWLLAFPCAFLANVHRARAHLDISVRNVIEALYKPMTASALMYVAVSLTRQNLAMQPLQLLAILIAVGCAAYMAASLAFNRAGVNEVLRLIKPEKT